MAGSTCAWTGAKSSCRAAVNTYSEAELEKIFAATAEPQRRIARVPAAERKNKPDSNNRRTRSAGCARQSMYWRRAGAIIIRQRKFPRYVSRSIKNLSRSSDGQGL
jgi:hypothetical protein